MGVFRKLKDVLFDTEEEEIPVITKKEEPKKEEKRKEEKPHYNEENTIKEIKIPKEEIPERELIKSESTFNFPVEVEEKPRSRTSRSLLEPDISSRKRDLQDFSRLLAEEPKKESNGKPFKSSPIISPVYGVLDHNYTKDDVIIKTDIGVKGPDLDAVRKKAYGLDKKEKPKKNDEDIFEDPLRTLDEILMEEEKVKAKKEAKQAETAEIEVASIEEVIPEKEKPKMEVTADLPTVEEVITEEIPTEEENPVIEKTISDTIETDLFNLIDSMYEDKERDEEE